MLSEVFELSAHLQGASARQLLQDAEHDDEALREGIKVHDRLYNTDVTGSLSGRRPPTD